MRRSRRLASDVLLRRARRSVGARRTCVLGASVGAPALHARSRRVGGSTRLQPGVSLPSELGFSPGFSSASHYYAGIPKSVISVISNSERSHQFRAIIALAFKNEGFEGLEAGSQAMPGLASTFPSKYAGQTIISTFIPLLSNRGNARGSREVTMNPISPSPPPGPRRDQYETSSPKVRKSSHCTR